MRVSRCWISMAVAAGLLGGCGDLDWPSGEPPTRENPNDTPPVVPSLGPWVATRFEVFMVADPRIRWDWLAAGASVRLELVHGAWSHHKTVEQGPATLTMRMPDKPDMVLTGEWQALANAFSFGPAQSTWEDMWSMMFAVRGGGDVLDLIGGWNLEAVFPATFDFDHDGSAEPASLNLTFVHE